ncbi:MAG: hemolysin III family protein [Anaerolineaceae bacterium]|nr:hemolysin III family protein [Anaerolineaceae bacterium]
MKIQEDALTKEYSQKEEIANGITHGIGIILGIVGLVFLILRAVQYGSVWHVVSYSIFGASLIWLYLASTLYHSIPKKSWKGVLKSMDHSAIFLLIAGTYTPFLLINLRGPWGWSLFGVIWGLAIAGFAMKIAFVYKFQKVFLALYVIMGWIVVIAMRQMILHVDSLNLILLFLGGISYTGGILFYIWKKLPFNHAIWHLFVLAGSIFHFFSIFLITV